MKGIPRYFGFYLSDKPEILQTEDEVDGYINLIFNEDLSIQSLHKFSSENKEPILWGLYKNTREIKTLLFEIEKVNKAIEINRNDLFAVKEFRSILEHQKNILNYFILDSIYANNKQILWSYKGEPQNISDFKSLNRLLSKISYDIYCDTPTYKNELINKTKTSSAISVARKNLIERIISNLNSPNLGFNENEFPPEKTIYLTLLKQTGLHKKGEYGFSLGEPNDDSFRSLWQAGERYLEKTKVSKRKVSELIEIFKEKPYKLKNGFIDFWLPTFILANQSHFAIYEQGRFLPELNSETINLT